MTGWFLRGMLARVRTPATVRECRQKGSSPAGPASGATGEAVRASAPVNGHHVLEQVVRLPVSTWRYHWDPPHVRHLGPMAQDWWAAFEVGEDDRTICCTDANGVAMVAIQALHRQLEDLRSEVAALREQVAQQHVRESRHSGPQSR
ncbi:tail fiber domain-containing protein [Streptomyces sp. 8N114]|uniref:tail fiber domain-containing protein n=1 Tax=Streptomyces sp. 8N114 TaxID=3457419 RepID=UPI003FCF8E45